MSKYRILLFISLIVTLLLGACSPVAPGISTPAKPSTEVGSTSPTATLTPVTLGVGFIPNVQFATFYVAIEKGFYAEEGLDVSLDYGFENDYLKLVGTDELQFMVGSGDQAVLGRAQGLPIRYVMNWYTKYPIVVFAKPEAGITRPEDLRGKTIGIPGPFGASYVAFRALLEAGNLSEADVKLESIGFTQAAAISEDKVDAAVDYAVSGPVVLKLQGTDTTIIALDQYLAIPANGLITNEKTLTEQPELVQKMVRASLRGVQYTLEHPDEAFEIALKFVPEAGGENRAANRAVFDAVLDFWQPRPDVPLGATTPEEWKNVAELMQRIGLVDTVVDPETLYTNEFIK
jgi:NitT/TauT family transport system substrate-binding protein